MKMGFYHVEKTGGLSFISSVSSNERNPGDDHFVFHGDQPTLEKARKGWDPEVIHDKRILVCEGAVEQVDPYFEGRFTWTLLRDPIERAVSWANDQIRRGQIKRGQFADLAELLREWPNVKFALTEKFVRTYGAPNLEFPVDLDAAFALAKHRLKMMDWVGFTDTWSDNQRHIWEKAQMPWTEPVHLNKSPRDFTLNEESETIIRSMTQLDRILYDWAKGEF